MVVDHDGKVVSNASIGARHDEVFDIIALADKVARDKIIIRDFPSGILTLTAGFSPAARRASTSAVGRPRHLRSYLGSRLSARACSRCACNSSGNRNSNTLPGLIKRCKYSV